MTELERMALTLKIGRAILNITQDELALITGVVKSTIARSESGSVAMRAETLIGTVRALRERSIHIDIYRLSDRVSLTIENHENPLPGILRVVRTAVGYTQHEMADALGIPESKYIISRLEKDKGKMSAELYFALCDFAESHQIEFTLDKATQTTYIVIKN